VTWVGVAGFEPAASSSRTKPTPQRTDTDTALACGNTFHYDPRHATIRQCSDARVTHADELLDALTAVRDAIAIPNAATVGDQETRDAILVERARDAVVMLDSILDGAATPDVPWSVAYLRARLAEHPAAGCYKTWDERVAELDAAKAASA
jgi:hypothetical protein